MTIYIILGLVILILWGVLITFGCKLCSNNNAWGLLLLFLGLNLLGLLIGAIILHNTKNRLQNDTSSDIVGTTDAHNHIWNQKEYNQNLKTMTYQCSICSSEKYVQGND